VSPRFEPRILRRTSGRARLHVPGLPAAADQIRRRVASLPGVIEARANPLTENLLVRYDPAIVDEPSLLAAVRAPSAGPAPRRAGRPPDGPGPAEWLEAERAVVVPAPPGTCVEVVCAFERYPEWQRFVTAVEVHERDRRGRGVLVETHAELGSRQVSHVMRYRYPTPGQVCFSQERGDLDAVEGGWQFRPAGPGRARARYRLLVRPGGLLSRFIHADLYERLREALLDHTLGELAGRVEQVAGGAQRRRGKMA